MQWATYSELIPSEWSLLCRDTGCLIDQLDGLQKKLLNIVWHYSMKLMLLAESSPYCRGKMYTVNWCHESQECCRCLYLLSGCLRLSKPRMLATLISATYFSVSEILHFCGQTQYEIFCVQDIKFFAHELFWHSRYLGHNAITITLSLLQVKQNSLPIESVLPTIFFWFSSLKIMIAFPKVCYLICQLKCFLGGSQFIFDVFVWQSLSNCVKVDCHRIFFVFQLHAAPVFRIKCEFPNDASSCRCMQDCRDILSYRSLVLKPMGPQYFARESLKNKIASSN